MAGVKQSAVPDGTMLCTSRDEVMAPESHEVVINQQAVADGWQSLHGSGTGTCRPDRNANPQFLLKQERFP